MTDAELNAARAVRGPGRTRGGGMKAPLLALLLASSAVLAADPPTSATIGGYSFPLDAEGRVLLDGRPFDRDHVRELAPANRPERGGVCVRICASYGVGQPTGNPGWNLYCLET